MLKLQYFGHLMGRVDSLKKTLCWKRLRTGGEGATEDEIVDGIIDFSGHELKQTQRDSKGQRNLACCSSWGCKELDTI